MCVVLVVAGNHPCIEEPSCNWLCETRWGSREFVRDCINSPDWRSCALVR